MIIDFFKKLFGGNVSSDSLENKIDNLIQKNISNEEVDNSLSEDNNKSRQVQKDGKLYRVNNNSIEVSKDNGKKWELFTDLPIECDAIKVSDDDKLMVLGSRFYKNFKENLKDQWTIAKEEFVPQNIGNKYDIELWEIRDRWYKLDDKGNLSVAIDPNNPNMFSPLETENTKMRIDDEDCYVRVYKMNPRETFYSPDGKRWKELGDLPQDFQEFVKKDGIVVVLDVKGNKYAYYGYWSLIEFESDMEVFEDDILYDDINQVYYKYNDEEGKIISKKIHMLFLEGSAITFVSDEGELNEHSTLPGFNTKKIKNVESCLGEVILTLSNDKQYVYFDGEWRQTNNLTDGVGPFCFKAKIEEKDSFWDKVDTPITEKGKDNYCRLIYYKIPKNNLKKMYYSSDGEKWFIHSELPEKFKTVTSTDYNCHAMAVGTIIYTKSKNHYRWVVKKKGLFSKTYKSEWEKCNDITLLEKVK